MEKIKKKNCMLNLDQRSRIKQALHHKLASLVEKGKFKPKSELKDDNSLVTEVDHFLSELIKKETHVDLCYYSEEDHSHLQFPAVILDPIDGTIEFAQGVAECAISYAYMSSSSLSDGEAWIYNPFSGFEIASDTVFTLPHKVNKQKYLGLVSRSEWKKGLYPALEDGTVQISPKGSVAYKLGLLAAGACDFIVSKKNKNIWDVAAGTVLLHKRGFSFYEKGIKIEKLDKQVYEAPMLWCREEDFAMLSSTLKLS